jgi:hypothetical protein
MKSTVNSSPAIVAILFLSAIVCVLALLWLPIKGLWWLLYTSNIATDKQVAVSGQQWMTEVKEALAPIPEQEEIVAISNNSSLIEEEGKSMAAETSAVEISVQDVSIPLTTVEEITTQETSSLQQAIINELRQLPTGKRRNAWGAICHHTKVSPKGKKFRNRSLESQAHFLACEKVPLPEISKAIQTALAS